SDHAVDLILPRGTMVGQAVTETSSLAVLPRKEPPSEPGAVEAGRVPREAKITPEPPTERQPSSAPRALEARPVGSAGAPTVTRGSAIGRVQNGTPRARRAVSGAATSMCLRHSEEARNAGGTAGRPAAPGMVEATRLVP